MSSEYIFSTKADEEAAIARYAATAARKLRQDWRMAGASIDAAPATEVYDSARDFAYDVLLAAHQGDVLVDMLLLDVTEAVVALVMG